MITEETPPKKALTLLSDALARHIEDSDDRKEFLRRTISEFIKNLEQIEGCGYMAYSVEEYAKKMNQLESSSDLYLEMSKKTYENYQEKYSYESIEKKILDLYQEIL